MYHGMKKFTFQWWIENYRFCWHDNGEILVSPKFTADGMEGAIWTLEIYPRGRHDDDKGYISLFLSRCSEDKGPKCFPLEFELSVRGYAVADVYSEDMSMDFKRGQTHGCPRFMKRDVVILSPDEGDGYLQEGTLSVHCKMWKGRGRTRKIASVCGRTRIGVEDISFRQIVEDFRALQPNQKISIHFLSHSKIECVLCNLYFTEVGQMVVEIMPSNNNHILCACVVSLINESGQTLESIGFENISSDLEHDIRKLPMKRFLTRQSIMGTRNFLMNDTLRLHYICYFSTGVELEEIIETRREMTSTTLNRIAINFRK